MVSRGNRRKETNVKKGTNSKQAKRPASETILSLIKRPGGATTGELMQATGWQRHSIRGFLSTASKKLGLIISGVQSAEGDRRYTAKPKKARAHA
jgi:hypothetical protein